jgi:hypothetical protein
MKNITNSNGRDFGTVPGLSPAPTNPIYRCNPSTTIELTNANPTATLPQIQVSLDNGIS